MSHRAIRQASPSWNENNKPAAALRSVSKTIYVDTNNFFLYLGYVMKWTNRPRSILLRQKFHHKLSDLWKKKSLFTFLTFFSIIFFFFVGLFDSMLFDDASIFLLLHLQMLFLGQLLSSVQLHFFLMRSLVPSCMETRLKHMLSDLCDLCLSLSFFACGTG